MSRKFESFSLVAWFMLFMQCATTASITSSKLISPPVIAISTIGFDSDTPIHAFEKFLGNFSLIDSENIKIYEKEDFSKQLFISNESSLHFNNDICFIHIDNTTLHNNQQSMERIQLGYDSISKFENTTEQDKPHIILLYSGENKDVNKVTTMFLRLFRSSYKHYIPEFLRKDKEQSDFQAFYSLQIIKIPSSTTEMDSFHSPVANNATNNILQSIEHRSNRTVTDIITEIKQKSQQDTINRMKITPKYSSLNRLDLNKSITNKINSILLHEQSQYIDDYRNIAYDVKQTADVAIRNYELLLQTDYFQQKAVDLSPTRFSNHIDTIIRNALQLYCDKINAFHNITTIASDVTTSSEVFSGNHNTSTSMWSTLWSKLSSRRSTKSINTNTANNNTTTNTCTTATTKRKHQNIRNEALYTHFHNQLISDILVTTLPLFQSQVTQQQKLCIAKFNENLPDIIAPTIHVVENLYNARDHYTTLYNNAIYDLTPTYAQHSASLLHKTIQTILSKLYKLQHNTDIMKKLQLNIPEYNAQYEVLQFRHMLTDFVTGRHEAYRTQLLAPLKDRPDISVDVHCLIHHPLGFRDASQDILTRIPGDTIVYDKDVTLPYFKPKQPLHTARQTRDKLQQAVHTVQLQSTNSNSVMTRVRNYFKRRQLEMKSELAREMIMLPLSIKNPGVPFMSVPDENSDTDAEEKQQSAEERWDYRNDRNMKPERFLMWDIPPMAEIRANMNRYFPKSNNEDGVSERQLHVDGGRSGGNSGGGLLKRFFRPATKLFSQSEPTHHTTEPLNSNSRSKDITVKGGVKPVNCPKTGK